MPQSHFMKAKGDRKPARVDITVTRSDLADVVHAAVPRVSRREARGLVDLVFDEVSQALLGGETVKLHTFGSFIVRNKRERVGRNPRTGVRVAIEPRRVITFKASPQMRDAIIESYGDLAVTPVSVSAEELESVSLPALAPSQMGVPRKAV
jgi:integration host factor subunit alpha